MSRKLRRLTGEDVDATLRRFKGSSSTSLTLQELRTVLHTMQHQTVSDDVREWVESELLQALETPEAYQRLGHFSLFASTAKLSPRAIDGLAVAMLRHDEVQSKALCTLACTISSRRVSTKATDQIIQAAIARLDNFSPKEASLFVHALSKIRNAPLAAVWPHILTNLERTWPGRDLALLCHVLSVARNDEVAYRVAELLPHSLLGPVDIVHALGLFSKMPRGQVTEVVQFLLEKLGPSKTQSKLPLDGFAGLCKTLARLGVLHDYIDFDRLKASKNAMGPSHLCVIGNAARTSSCNTILDLLVPRVVSVRQEFQEPRHFAIGMMAYKEHSVAIEALVARLISRQDAGASRFDDFSTQEVVMLSSGSQSCDNDTWWDRLADHIVSRQWPCSELIQLGMYCSQSLHAKRIMDYVVANTVIDELQLVDATILLSSIWKVQVSEPTLVRKIWSQVEVLMSQLTTIDLSTFNGLLLASKEQDLPQDVLLRSAERVIGSRIDQWAYTIGQADEELFLACLPSARSACGALEDSARRKLREILARTELGRERERMIFK